MPSAAKLVRSQFKILEYQAVEPGSIPGSLCYADCMGRVLVRLHQGKENVYGKS